ncbi:phosphoglucosamine mutase [Formosimonas limnophila]|uniref:Phosphoglucosamine mutase n=1 Tax=Formosimonas limnophila TaxID=1384487 RepID=A0A8J3CIF6_9BURK|nr:phosphoglucosamine mutase [Formosimonas limnophila]GHA77966.1 phosphoglucosamine mutase [Formosimonas limnophila]
MARKYFGTDGVRGRVGQYPITPDFVMKLGYAAGKVLAHDLAVARPCVLIGKDTRISGYMLEAALEAGFAAAGVDVMLCGPMPTPAIAYLTRALRLQAGVVISASHNPFEDNGIKFFSAKGDKLSDEKELEIEAQLDLEMSCVSSEKLGKAKRLEDAAGRYIEFCKSTFPNEFDLRGLKIVVDAAHGAAYHIAQPVLHELGAEVITIGVSPNGLNINDQVGATAPDALMRSVRANHADLGIALDGDADRVVMVDARGVAYDGDQLLYAIAATQHAATPITGVVGTLMSNLGLEKALTRLGIEFARAKVGDRYVLEQLKERGWLYGGESSGHILCLDKHTTGDGIVSALQVLAAMRRSGQTLAQLVQPMSMYPQTMINVRVEKGFDWQNHAGLNAAKAKAEQALGDTGRILIRASGTEPLIRVMVEAEDAKLAKEQAELMAQSLKV